MIWLAIIILVLLFFHGAHTFTYWIRRGVRQESLISFLRVSKRLCLQQISDTEVYENIYVKHPKERFVGTYFAATPLLVIRDPDLVKHILVNDFKTFYSRAFPQEKVPEPLYNHLVTCDGDLWKLLRQSISPAFSPVKVKAMFPLLLSRAEKLQEIVFDEVNSDIDVKDLFLRYAVDVTGACGFGIETKTLSNEHKTLLKLAQRVFTRTPRDVLVYILKFTMPALFKSLRVIPPFVDKATRALVDVVLKQRNYKPSERSDIINFLLELKAKGKIVGSSLVEKNEDGSARQVELEFSDTLLTAQVFMFFAAGTDTTATSGSYALYEIAHHPEVQRKCQEEIDTVLARHGNKLSYEAVNEMKYLEACYREGLRMFGPASYLMRKCMSTYTIPGTSITLQPGVLTAIPTHALHMDPQYFPNPEEFCPDRFLPENIGMINKNAYVPFGAGPRACIGERLGILQSLAALAALLRCAHVLPAAPRPRKQPFDTSSALAQRIRGPLLLKFTMREQRIL